MELRLLQYINYNKYFCLKKKMKWYAIKFNYEAIYLLFSAKGLRTITKERIEFTFTMNNLVLSQI